MSTTSALELDTFVKQI